MSNLNDETTETFTGVASGATSGTVPVNSSDPGDSVLLELRNESGTAVDRLGMGVVILEATEEYKFTGNA